MNLESDLGFLRIFECKAFVYIHKELRHGKFEPRSKEGIFVGDSAGNGIRIFPEMETKLYHQGMLNLSNKKIWSDSNAIFLRNMEILDLCAGLHNDANNNSMLERGHVSNVHSENIDENNIADEEINAEDLTYYPGIRRSSGQSSSPDL